LSRADDIPFHLAWPWCDMPSQQASVDAGRLCITTDADVDRTVAQGLTDDLPLLSAWTDSAGQQWKRFELPSVAAESEAGPAIEMLTVVLQSRRAGRRRVDVRLVGLPRLSHADKQEDGDTPSDSWHEASSHAEGIIDRHIELVNRLYDENQPQEPPNAWQGHAEGMAVRHHGAVIRAWQESGGRDEPRMALVVRLERGHAFRRLLNDVCNRPRRILVRQRQMQGIARIQEVDPACMRWMVRQPGVSVAQKAGIRQEALGVVRVETADTPENRVVRDLVRRAIIACNRYIAENHRFRQHQRVRLIRRFRQELRDYLTRTPLADVHPLVGVPTPNYVLQHDARYRPLWDVYLKLVRQQKEQDEAWRWRHRIWAEHLTLGVMASLEMGDSGMSPPNADLFIRAEQVCGKFLDPSGVPASWRLAGKEVAQAIDLVPGDSISAHPGIPASLAALGADLLLIRRPLFSTQPLSILLIWAVLDFDIVRDGLQERTASISLALRTATAPCAMHGLLVQPSFAQAAGSHRATATEKNATGIRTALPEDVSCLAAAVREGLSMVRAG